MSPHNQSPAPVRRFWPQFGLILLNTAINCTFHLINPLGTNNRFFLRPRHNLPSIILHDGVILLHHGIYPHLLGNYFLKWRMLIINQLCHEWYTCSIFILWSPISMQWARSCNILMSILHQFVFLPRSLPPFSRRICVSGFLPSSLSLLLHLWLLHNIL